MHITEQRNAVDYACAVQQQAITRINWVRIAVVFMILSSGFYLLK